MSHAYTQLSVDKARREYLTISTHKGLYSYTKLLYGVKSAPKIFQAKMDMILQGVEKCVCKQDNILESYVKAFQYKVLHNILYTNKKLFKIGFRTDDVCTFCEAEQETLYHILYQCSYSRRFWNDFESYWCLLTNEAPLGGGLNIPYPCNFLTKYPVSHKIPVTNIPEITVSAIFHLYNNQVNARALIGQSAMVYCAGKLMEKSRVF